jgi:hypothetical protein
VNRYKKALEKIVALDLGGVNCENPKHWQAYQFHKARKIATEALKLITDHAQPKNPEKKSNDSRKEAGG